jgi:hypothetical protein
MERVYRRVCAGDAEGTAIAVAYELLRAEFSEKTLAEGPPRTGKPASDIDFHEEAAGRIGRYAGLLLSSMREHLPK